MKNSPAKQKHEVVMRSEILVSSRKANRLEEKAMRHLKLALAFEALHHHLQVHRERGFVVVAHFPRLL